MRALASFARPFLRRDVPIVWVDDDIVRIGAGQRAPRVRATRSQVAWLTSLDGTGRACDPGDVGDGTDPSGLLDAAIAAGAIDDAARIPASWRWLDAQQRWALEPQLLAASHAYGCDGARDALDRRVAASVHVPGAHALAAAVREAVHASGLALAERLPATCTVLAAGSSPADLGSAHLAAMRGPHVVVTALGAEATVGPLVVPGETSCLRCEQLHRTDRDAGWCAEQAQLLAHETRLRIRPEDPLLMRAAADLAVALVRAWIDGRDGSWRDRAFAIALPLLETTASARPRHPLCGCWWPGA